MKTMDQVRARYTDESRRSHDLFGFGSAVLGVHLPEGWQPGNEHVHELYPLTEEFVRGEAIEYLKFAFDKALNHRGISAGRSVTKMREYAWLLDMDEAVAFADDGTNYPYYGVPVLKHMARAFGVPLPSEIEAWEDGLMCRLDCMDGCST